jgi:glycosyltransferase involved in cell wall biosynthesis
MNEKPTLVHVTHEAAGKIGGIGAVLEGLLTCEAYLEGVGRSILISPLFSVIGSVSDRLGPDGDVLYSSIDGHIETSYVSTFRRIEEAFNVSIVYGRRTFIDKLTGIKSSPEVVLIDVTRSNLGPVNRLKKGLFEEFGIRSHLYEHLWEYEQYVRLAPPVLAVLRALGVTPSRGPRETQGQQQTILVAHEFMGMPTALAAVLEPQDNIATVFYAHEVATMRRIVEQESGHDTMFYNVMGKARREKVYVDEVFGVQSSYFKHVLVQASRYCDNIISVGSHVADELRFLAPEFESANIDIVYNGIPAYQITLEDKLASRGKLQQYCRDLLRYNPDYIFTHVTRLVPSKGLWRDLRVLENLETEFRNRGKTAVMFVLSTEVSRRQGSDIYRIESQYGWPVAHREGMPDMSGGEAYYYTGVQQFNAQSRNIKVVFINQFGFNRAFCGRRMPGDMEFMDIRKGSDLEFGLSIYEPFGIAQLEPLSFGSICLFSNVCGCTGFIKDIAPSGELKNIIIADYTELDGQEPEDLEDMLQIDGQRRDRIEEQLSRRLTGQICARLPEDENQMRQLIQSGYELASQMSWQRVVEDYLLASLQKALDAQQHRRQTARRA